MERDWLLQPPSFIVAHGLAWGFRVSSLIQPHNHIVCRENRAQYLQHRYDQDLNINVEMLCSP